MTNPTEDPYDLLERTNLAEYLRARKAIAAESSQLGLPTRPVLPGVLRVDETVSNAMTMLSTMRVQVGGRRERERERHRDTHTTEPTTSSTLSADRYARKGKSLLSSDLRPSKTATSLLLFKTSPLDCSDTPCSPAPPSPSLLLLFHSPPHS